MSYHWHVVSKPVSYNESRTQTEDGSSKKSASALVLDCGSWKVPCYVIFLLVVLYSLKVCRNIESFRTFVRPQACYDTFGCHNVITWVGSETCSTRTGVRWRRVLTNLFWGSCFETFFGVIVCSEQNSSRIRTPLFQHLMTVFLLLSRAEPLSQLFIPLRQDIARSRSLGHCPSQTVEVLTVT